MAEIKIQYAEYGVDYDIKEEVSGGEKEFDESFVIAGNDDYKEITEATWWKRARQIMEDIDAGYMIEDEDVTEEQAKEIKKIYERCRYCDSIDTLVDVLNVLYPEKEFDSHQIHGSVQREWQTVVCSEEDSCHIREIESLYFGEVKRLDYVDGSMCAIVLDDDLYTWEREGSTEKEIRGIFEIDDDEDVEVYQMDGYISVPNWRQIV